MADSSLAQYLKQHIQVKDEAQQKLLEEALLLTGKQMESKLLSSGVMNEADLTKLKAEYYHLPFLSTEQLEIPDSAKALIPSALLRTYKVVPFAKENNLIKIAISDPTNLQMLEALEFLAKKNNWNIELYLVTEKELEALLQKNTGADTEVKQALEEFSETRSVYQPLSAESKAAEVEEKAPVAKIVDGVLSQALAQRASDVHIEPMYDRSRVRFRIDGVLKEVFTFPLDAHSAVVSKIKILANLKIDEQRLPQDGRFKFSYNDKNVDFRVSTFPTAHGEKVVLRLLQRADNMPNFEQLGIFGQRAAAIGRATSSSHGMLLVTGPTGSGKSTTLFVALSQLNKPGVNIITLEDPVEYVLPGVNQAQVNPEIGFTFAAGLRSILRQDPNVILIGEIRDRETAELAVHSALTGHLVFSTLHTNDSIGAIPRMIDMGVEPFLIVASTNAILAQRLVRTICPDCKEEVEVTKEVKDLLVTELEKVPKEEVEGLDIKNPKIYKGKGCKKCGDTGYKGRMGIYEAVEMTKEIGELTLSKANPSKMREVALSQGMVTIRQDGFIKVLKGLTTIEEVLKETNEDK